MFIYSDWDFFCSEVSTKYRCIRADEILHQGQDEEWLVIKHDVETNVRKALILAKIENKYGIRATYYVQSCLLEGESDLLREIKALGHEVTYHYDVLDSNKGSIESSIKEFGDTVIRFKKEGFDVKTICPHGNPVMERDGWTSNKDFFRNENVRLIFPNIFDIVVDSIYKIPNGYVYISDAGYGWKEIGNINSNDISNFGDVNLGDINGVLDNLSKSPRIIISAHPHRWQKNKLNAWLGRSLFVFLRLMARIIVKNKFMKKIISKFYFLAKKI